MFDSKMGGHHVWPHNNPIFVCTHACYFLLQADYLQQRLLGILAFFHARLARGDVEAGKLVSEPNITILSPLPAVLALHLFYLSTVHLCIPFSTSFHHSSSVFSLDC